MTEIGQLKCEACDQNAIPLSAEELDNYMEGLPSWQIIEREGVKQLERMFRFKNFKQAWAFSNLIAELAETEFHHPTITLEWGKVTVTWWSHSIKGLHRNDIICATKTDAYFNNLTN